MYKVTLQWQIGHQIETQEIQLGTVAATIGRRADNTVVVMHNTVSRLHASLTCNSRGIFLRNLSQTNPVIHQNTTKITYGQEMPLRTGDLFQIGRVTFKVLGIHNPLSGRIKRKCANCLKLSDEETKICPHCGASMESSETLILPKKPND